tara:strand:- start:531 stop:737 length:207 start_codon:yes stop_codon:yes gene_type:complete
MPKFKIVIVVKHSGGSSTVDYNIEEYLSRAEATKAYHALISKLEDEVNKAQETLNALVENGHIVEVDE